MSSRFSHCFVNAYLLFDKDGAEFVNNGEGQTIAHDFYDGGYAAASFTSRTSSVLQGLWKDLAHILTDGIEVIFDKLKN